MHTVKAKGILYDTNAIFTYLHTFKQKNLPKQLSIFDS